MTAFIALNTFARTGLLLLFLLLQLSSLGVGIMSLNGTRKKAIFHGAFALTSLCFFMLTALTAPLYERNAGLLPKPFTAFFAGLPVGFYLLMLLLGGAAALFMLHQEWAHRRGMITRAAIKESADNLPAGLCFGASSGLVLLANRTMEGLCHSLTGFDLQDAAAFWDIIATGELKGGAKRLPDTENPIIRLASGRTWSFDRRVIEADGQPVLQITATDSTDLDILHLRLTEGNAELAKMNARLRRFSETIVEVTAKEERLATKTRLHNELGHTLLTTRHILSKEMDEEQALPILDLWKRNIAVLRTGAEANNVTLLEHLTEAAADVGITLKIKGALPKGRQNIQRLIITAGSEALNNAVRHAAATELYMEVLESKGSHIAMFSNNGKIPDTEVIEGGGLSALRTRIERQGGAMTLQSRPVFKLTITLPEGKGE